MLKPEPKKELLKMNKRQLDIFMTNSGKNSNSFPNMIKENASESLLSDFTPYHIVLAKGSLDTPERRALSRRICSFFPQAVVVECPETPHNRINMGVGTDAYIRHREGKKTLVLGVMKSAVRVSSESGNTCPNFWHYSVFGFCPYECSYCYLAGTPGVWYSPTVKIYVNLPEIIDCIDRQSRKISKPVSFYHGKLQDGLALESITGYMQTLVPFFARHPFARNIILTKSVAVDSLLPLDHRGNTILSWSLNPPEIASKYELNTPPITARIDAMKRCADAGYPVRAVLMPVIPVPGWKNLYVDFLESLLDEIALERLTIGGICSYVHAEKLMIRHIGEANAVSSHMSSQRSRGDGRHRYPPELRVEMYRLLVDTARHIQPDLHIALCLEEVNVWRAVDPRLHPGECNCVL